MNHTRHEEMKWSEWREVKRPKKKTEKQKLGEKNFHIRKSYNICSEFVITLTALGKYIYQRFVWVSIWYWFQSKFIYIFLHRQFCAVVKTEIVYTNTWKSHPTQPAMLRMPCIALTHTHKSGTARKLWLKENRKTKFNISFDVKLANDKLHIATTAATHWKKKIIGLKLYGSVLLCLQPLLHRFVVEWLSCIFHSMTLYTYPKNY